MRRAGVVCKLANRITFDRLFQVFWRNADFLSELRDRLGFYEIAALQEALKAFGGFHRFTVNDDEALSFRLLQHCFGHLCVIRPIVIAEAVSFQVDHDAAFQPSSTHGNVFSALRVNRRVKADFSGIFDVHSVLLCEDETVTG